MSIQTERDLIPIGRVVEVLRASHPDVTHSSLRFLEREGLVTPARSPGGHRYYTLDDVDRVRQIKAWQAQRLSLEEIRERLAALRELEPAGVGDRFLRHATRGELAAAARVVLQADDLGMPLLRLFRDALTPALWTVGERWERGELAVGQEKEISELARDVIAELSLRHADPDPRGPVVVAACVEGEHHDLGLRMVCGLLQAGSWRVHFLGASVAPEFLLEAVRLHQPAVVLLSATLERHLGAVAAALAALETSRHGAGQPTVVVGGRAAAKRADTLDSRHVVLAAVDGLTAAANGTLADVGSGSALAEEPEGGSPGAS